MSEGLEDFPQAFTERETMPWETPVDGIRWQWGADKGRLLTELSSRELLRKRKWLQRDPAAFAKLIAEIDKVLTDREGL